MFLDHPMKDVVLTVPSFFTQAERRSVMRLVYSLRFFFFCARTKVLCGCQELSLWFLADQSQYYYLFVFLEQQNWLD